MIKRLAGTIAVAALSLSLVACSDDDNQDDVEQEIDEEREEVDEEIDEERDEIQEEKDEIQDELDG